MRTLITSQNVRELTLSIGRRFQTFPIQNHIGLGLEWTQHHGGPLHNTPRGRGYSPGGPGGYKTPLRTSQTVRNLYQL